MTDCIFCKIVNKEIPADIVYESENSIAFKDINPVAPIHFLVIPKKHFESLNEADQETLGVLLEDLKALAKQEGIEDYRTVFNTGAKAGQTVFHLHAHLIAARELDWPPG